VASALYALAALVGGAAYLYRVRRSESLPLLARNLLWLILGGFLGANLGGAAMLVSRLTGAALPFALKDYSILGALLGGTATALWLCRRYAVSFWGAADQGIPALPLALSIGRLGCFARGCCYGAPTASWLGLYLPDRAGNWLPRYPTQLLSAAANLLIFLVLLAVERYGRPREGEVTRLFFALFLLKRFGIEFLRGDALPAVLGPFNTTHLTCLTGLALVAVVSLAQARTPQKSTQRRRDGENAEIL
jgi:phosphatidylglycerol:prolipoprotein diacylglycerol transferase